MSAHVRHVRIDDTTWPVESADLSWALRYAPAETRSEVQRAASSIVSAYAYLCAPFLTQKQAIEALKRARKAHRTADVPDTER